MSLKKLFIISNVLFILNLTNLYSCECIKAPSQNNNLRYQLVKGFFNKTIENYYAVDSTVTDYEVYKACIERLNQYLSNKRKFRPIL